MKLNTASEIINFAVKLEDNSAKFYENLAQRYEEGREIFLLFAQENKKNKTLVKRTYYEVISDALEAGFSFKSLNTDDYLLETGLIEDKGYFDILRMAIEIEERIQKFYLVTAEQSKSLMADIPRAFERIARKRNERKLKLRSLLKEQRNRS